MDFLYINKWYYDVTSVAIVITEITSWEKSA